MTFHLRRGAIARVGGFKQDHAHHNDSAMDLLVDMIVAPREQKRARTPPPPARTSNTSLDQTPACEGTRLSTSAELTDRPLTARGAEQNGLPLYRGCLKLPEP